MSKIITKIQEIQSKLQEENKDQRQDEFKSILDTTYEYHYSTGFSSDKFSGFCFYDKTTLAINNVPVSLGYIIDNLIPKCVILDQIDSLVAPAQTKLDRLIKKAEKDSKYNNVKIVAQEVIEAADRAREIIIQTNSIKEGLRQAEATITEVYTENNNSIFAEHRGNPIINTLINFLQQLAGYCMLIITSPFRLYDSEGVESYVNSWFQKRQTESMKIFGTFKKEMTTENLEKVAGLRMD